MRFAEILNSMLSGIDEYNKNEILQALIFEVEDLCAHHIQIVLSTYKKDCCRIEAIKIILSRGVQIKSKDIIDIWSTFNHEHYALQAVKLVVEKCNYVSCITLFLMVKACVQDFHRLEIAKVMAPKIDFITDAQCSGILKCMVFPRYKLGMIYQLEDVKLRMSRSF